MPSRQIFSAILLLGAVLILSPVVTASPSGWDAPRQGNPIIPGYFADPSFVEYQGKQYIYATLDPWGKNTLGCWESADFKNWTYRELNWPTKQACTSPTSNKNTVWAPSVVRASDGKFYMYTSVGSEIWAGTADHPLGPWKSLTKPNTPLVARTWKDLHNIDAEAFIDDDGSAYLYWGSGWNWTNGHCLVVKLKPDMVTFDGEPKDVTPDHYFEGPLMLKHGKKYYLMYSEGMIIKDTYEVRYAIGDSPFGPFKEASNSPILSTDHSKSVVSPGHHTVFHKDGKAYILYHRMVNPYENKFTSRELCIDPLNFTSDGLIAKIDATHQGPALVQGRLANQHKYTATASSTAGERFTPDRALDDNYSTRWMPSPDAQGAWLQIDLKAERKITHQEIRFEYPWKKYAFTLEQSTDGKTWQLVADFRSAPATGSPVVVDAPIQTRFLRLIFPETQKGKDIGIWEWVIVEK